MQSPSHVSEEKPARMRLLFAKLVHLNPSPADGKERPSKAPSKLGASPAPTDAGVRGGGRNSAPNFNELNVAPRRSTMALGSNCAARKLVLVTVTLLKVARSREPLNLEKLRSELLKS